MKKKRRNYFETLVTLLARISELATGHDLLQIWYVDSPRSGTSLKQIWLNWGKWSQSYIGRKITFFVFLSIYSQCDATASWAARYMYLDSGTELSLYDTVYHDIDDSTMALIYSMFEEDITVTTAQIPRKIQKQQWNFDCRVLCVAIATTLL